MLRCWWTVLWPIHRNRNPGSPLVWRLWERSRCLRWWEWGWALFHRTSAPVSPVGKQAHMCENHRRRAKQTIQYTQWTNDLYLNFIYFIWHYLVGCDHTPQSEKGRRTDERIYTFLVLHVFLSHKGQLGSYRPHQILMTP